VRTAVVILVAFAAAACSGGDDRSSVTSPTADPPPVSTAAATPAATPASTAANPSSDQVVVAASTFPIVPETGVPGLDGADAFCAAWSRFGGTWQVLLVGSAFLDDPDEIARWEVTASPVIADAYDALLADLPGELAPEADVVAEGFFGALARRSAVAGAALVAAGATDEQTDRLATAWLAALAMRDPSSADIQLAVPADLRAIVDAAAATLRSERTQFGRDPSMVIGVSTPLTESYLATACPDQGALMGQEVPGG
jgi:hypothetical protein